MVDMGEQLLLDSFIRTLITFLGLHPHDLIISEISTPHTIRLRVRVLTYELGLGGP
jgi:hypothetical protein